MHIRYWGDSYDLVKQALLRWLRPTGEWSVHPMFTEAVTPQQAQAFAAFLGASLLSDDVLTPSTPRGAYLACGARCANLFLHPDTGVRIAPVRGRRAPEFLFAHELIALGRERPDHLTMVFDQSHPRGSTRSSLEAKLQHLGRSGMASFAYESHDCFIASSFNADQVIKAHEMVLAESRLLSTRLICHLPSRSASARAA